MMNRVLFGFYILCISQGSSLSSEIFLKAQTFPDSAAVQLPVLELSSINNEKVELQKNEDKWIIALKDEDSLAAAIKVSVSEVPAGFTFFPIQFVVQFDNARNIELPIILTTGQTGREEVIQLRRDSATLNVSMEQLLKIYQRAGMMLRARIADIETTRRNPHQYDVVVAYIYLASLNELSSKTSIAPDDFKDRAVDWLANTYKSNESMVQSAIGPGTDISELLGNSRELVSQKYQVLYDAIANSDLSAMQLRCPRYFKLQTRITTDAKLPNTKAAERLTKNIVAVASDCRIKLATLAVSPEAKMAVTEVLEAQVSIIEEISAKPAKIQSPALAVRKIELESMLRRLHAF